METDGLETAVEVAMIARTVWKACHQAEDSEEPRSELGTFVFTMHHCLYSIRVDKLNDQVTRSKLQAVRETLKKTELFVQADPCKPEPTPMHSSTVRAELHSQQQAERTNAIRTELQTQLRELMSLTTESIRDLLTQLYYLLRETNTKFSGKQCVHRVQLIQFYDVQCTELENLEKVFCEADHDRNVSEVLKKFVNAISGIIGTGTAARTIEHLVDIMHTDTEDTRERSALALWGMAVNADNWLTIAACGGIRPLVELLLSGTAVAKVYAAGALGKLALDADNRVVFAVYGGTEPLVALLRTGADGAKETAVGALWSLSLDADNQVKIAAYGGIEPLVALLRTGLTVPSKKQLELFAT